MSEYQFRTFGYDGEGFCCYFYFQKWQYLNLGVHISLEDHNIEIHVPFGFFRVGWRQEHGFASNRWVWNESAKERFGASLWEAGE